MNCIQHTSRKILMMFMLAPLSALTCLQAAQEQPKHSQPARHLSLVDLSDFDLVEIAHMLPGPDLLNFRNTSARIRKLTAPFFLPHYWCQPELQNRELGRKDGDATIPIAFSPDGRFLAFGYRCTSSYFPITFLQLCDLKTHFKESSRIGDHMGDVNSIAFSPNGNYLAIGTVDGSFILLDLETGDIIKKSKCREVVDCDGIRTRGCCSVAFLPNNTLVTFSKWLTYLELWNEESETKIASYTRDGTPLDDAIISPDGKLMAFGDNNTILIVQLENGKEVQKLQESFRISRIAFSPDGKLLASASKGSIHVWNIINGQLVKTLLGWFCHVNCLAFAPDSKLLASGCDDRAIRVWDVQTGQQLLKWNQEKDRIDSLAFSPDGLLLAASSDHFVYLWKPVSPKKNPSYWYDFFLNTRK